MRAPGSPEVFGPGSPAAAGLDDATGRAPHADALDRPAEGIVHDFNNLLTVILGHAQVLADALPPGDLRASALEIQDASQRAARLASRLRELGRERPGASEPSGA